MSVSTPLGVKSDVVLPDGSRVRLNGGTRIVYPALFGDERRVEVDGEAYFEVEHDARRPFVVVTGQVVSTVLGTTFKVHAYSEDENYQITLATAACWWTAVPSRGACGCVPASRDSSRGPPDCCRCAG